LSDKARLEAIIRGSPRVMHVLETIRDLAIPDWLLFSGGVYQTAINHLTGREPDYGLKDYDIGYFDPSDISYEAEDLVIRRVADAFASPLKEMVEVRNQARVHLWFEAKFGEAYTPLSRTAEALSRFTTTTFAVGVRLEPDGRMTIEAPFGLTDLFALRLRPNPNRQTAGFARTAESAVRRWPELTVLEG
jgi:uncharacterized protein